MGFGRACLADTHQNKVVTDSPDPGLMVLELPIASLRPWSIRLTNV